MNDDEWKLCMNDELNDDGWTSSMSDENKIQQILMKNKKA
jgi:hypothetical protein